MNPHYTISSSLGCPGCSTSTHGHFLSFCSPIASSKTVLHELVLNLSASVLSDSNPHRDRFDKSLAEGTLGRYTPCLLSAAIRKLTKEIASDFSLNSLSRLEQILLENEEKESEQARTVAREVAEATARQIATAVAESVASGVAEASAVDAATRVASQIAADTAASKVKEPEAKQKLETFVSSPFSSFENIPKEVFRQTIETKQKLETFVSAQFSSFDNIPKEVFRQTIEEASKNTPTVTKKYDIPEQLASQVPQLALYDFIIVCDNSASMKSEHARIPTLRASVSGIFRILSDLGSNRPLSIVPYSGKTFDNLRSEDAINKALDSISYGGVASGSNASMPLSQTVLPRLESQIGDRQLNPTVVVVITDGNVGDIAKFAARINKFKAVLHNKYKGPAVLFLICRVGSDQQEAEKLKDLKRNKDIRDMMFYSEDQLDAKLVEKQNNLEAYTGYVMGKVLNALELHLLKT